MSVWNAEERTHFGVSNDDVSHDILLWYCGGLLSTSPKPDPPLLVLSLFLCVSDRLVSCFYLVLFDCSLALFLFDSCLKLVHSVSINCFDFNHWFCSSSLLVIVQ